MQVSINYLDADGTLFDEGYRTLTNVEAGQRAEFAVGFYTETPDRLAEYTITVEAWDP